MQTNGRAHPFLHAFTSHSLCTQSVRRRILLASFQGHNPSSPSYKFHSRLRVRGPFRSVPVSSPPVTQCHCWILSFTPSDHTPPWGNYLVSWTSDWLVDTRPHLLSFRWLTHETQQCEVEINGHGSFSDTKNLCFVFRTVLSNSSCLFICLLI
jgi:hypothetical protein